ncbi:uncharacterized protein Z518_10806 [Rhinocladiella mackenziei CBS 650.93]|uniref:Rhinocladiella mackenziei CBS 650.93 unplaced genomic scaffold supercont1.10, whole genome shotgun sequence n=1 Tax=Rhinocladiella mackenziei CBS 650.93 TaxID=1442369 RepID=A0A0D2I296_9EURO|nr:uncharacterized protein Z518_10806 [Rhinocladiella mackenziei CBS 650.93]KIW99878.1 hypothetical protein Z518_10806 [Rhinocladiella mackenziei CBS 650.93]
MKPAAAIRMPPTTKIAPQNGHHDLERQKGEENLHAMQSSKGEAPPFQLIGPKIDFHASFCRNCERLKFDCSFARSADGPSASENSSDFQVQLERRRGALACIECRSQKIKCPGDFPTCGNCLRRNRPCSYPVPKRPTREYRQRNAPEQDHRPESPTNGVQVSSASGPHESDNFLPGPNEVIVLIEAYFLHVYQLPWYAFVHKDSVIQRFIDGTIEPCLTLAICATTTQRIKFEQYSSELSAKWAGKAEEFIMETLETPSISRLQALMLVVRWRVEAGQFSRAFMLAALAGRFAVALRLNYERPELRFLAQEVRRRLMWSCFVLDSHFSIGLREYEYCSPDIIYLQLPCPETEFEDDVPVETAPLRAVSFNTIEGLGTYAACVRLVAIRRDIMRLTRRVASSPMQVSELMRAVRQFEAELEHLYRSIAEIDKYSPTIFLHSKKQARHLMLHQSWHLSHCDLYRIFLTGYREAAPASTLEGIDNREILRMQSLCLQHALTIVQIIAEFSKHCTAQTIDSDTAICAYHSTRIILFTSQTDRLPQRLSKTAALEQVRVCQNIMNRFFATSPVVEPMKKEMEMLIAQHSSKVTSNNTLLVSPREDGMGDDDSKIRDEARARQRLAIHSLVRRADFVDDSNEVTSPAHTHVHRSPAKARQKVSSVRNMLIEPPARRNITPVGILESSQNALNQGPRITEENNRGESTRNEESESDQWMDGMRFAFNPWMGWSETLEAYGFSQDMDGDYF